MTISSIGVGSGLDVNSIVSQLVAIEKQPLTNLATKATAYQAQLSMYGTLNSEVSTLEDAAGALATASGWNVLAATSSNTTAVGVAVGSTASAGNFSVVVSELASAQTAASRAVATGTGLGASGETGSLTINLGSWTSGTFAAGGSSLQVTGINGDDSLSTIAAKINAARSPAGTDAGVTATVLKIDGKDQLVVRSKTTGEKAGFQITSSGFSGLASLSFDSLSNSSGSTSGMVKGQLGLNAVATFNGLAISSASNTLTDVVPGVTLTLSQRGASDITVVQDKEALKTKIQKFADAFSALSKTLADSTKYVPGGASGALQGDSTTVGIQTLLRNTLFAVSGTGSDTKRLSDVGLELQKDGTLKLNATKLTTAMDDMSSLQKVFTQAGTGQSDNGFALKFKTFAHGLLNASSTSSVESAGALLDKKKAIQSSIDRNSADQGRITARAAVVEAALRKQYSALDSQMATLTSLGSYVTAQLAQWNKTTG